MSEDEQPVFVRALSRSGGTLMVTVLDAHPDIAMSYELYPPMLELADGSADAIEKYMSEFSRARSIKEAAKKIANGKFKTFIIRCERGGLDIRDLESIFRAHLDENRNFLTSQNRLEFVAKCCRIKMEKEGKLMWGLKCNNKYSEYLAKFVFYKHGAGRQRRAGEPAKHGIF